MINVTEYQMARNSRLTGGAVTAPEHPTPRSQRSLQSKRSRSPQSPYKDGHDDNIEDEDEWDHSQDEEEDRRNRSSSPESRPRPSAAQRCDELREMLKSPDITAVEQTIDEHAGHKDLESQDLRRQLIQHREVSQHMHACQSVAGPPAEECFASY
eukprot:COSAG06_NODE_3457_length_5315_cov_2.923121_2_plen_155_part_00